MEKIKLLLYCNRQLPYLMKIGNNPSSILNGYIVAECDFEVEEIEHTSRWNGWFGLIEYKTPTLSSDSLEKKSCIEKSELDHYLNRDYGYAIHIKNLHIFDESKELSYYWKKGERVKNAPRNMILVQNIYEDKVVISLKEVNAIKVEEKVLMSVSSKELSNILNGKQTILVRKKVLKEMI